MGLTKIKSKKILDGTLTDADVDAANKDGLPSVPSMRTLGTGAQQACAGNDPRLSAIAPQFVDDETPVKISNKIYNLAYSPNPAASLMLFVSGVFMVRGVDYTVSGNVITFTKAPGASAAIRAFYRR